MNESLIETQLNYVQAATDEKHDISLVQQPNDLSYESFQYDFEELHSGYGNMTISSLEEYYGILKDTTGSTSLSSLMTYHKVFKWKLQSQFIADIYQLYLFTTPSLKKLDSNRVCHTNGLSPEVVFDIKFLLR